MNNKISNILVSIFRSKKNEDFATKRKFYNIVVTNNLTDYHIDASHINMLYINGRYVDFKEYYNCKLNLIEKNDISTFRHIYRCRGLGCIVVSQKLKDVLYPYVKDNYDVEFFPVFLANEKLGTQQYYIIHFKMCVRAILYNYSSLAYSASLGRYYVIKSTLNYERVKDLDFFFVNSINGAIFSEEIYNALKKEFGDSLVIEEVKTI